MTNLLRSRKIIPAPPKILARTTSLVNYVISTAIILDTMFSMPNPDRTALLIRCSKDEAERIRQGARNERRTVSAYVLQAVMNRLSVDKRLQEMKQNAATRGSKY
jgi:hypothetical protein